MIYDNMGYNQRLSVGSLIDNKSRYMSVFDGNDLFILERGCFSLDLFQDNLLSFSSVLNDFEVQVQ